MKKATLVLLIWLSVCSILNLVVHIVNSTLTLSEASYDIILAILFIWLSASEIYSIKEDKKKK